MGLFSAVKWFAAGWAVHSLLRPAHTDGMPPWWQDVMIRAFAVDQMAPKPPQISQGAADAAGAAASAVQIPIGWLYALLLQGMDAGKLQIAASALAEAAEKAGPPADASPASLSAYRQNLVMQVASALIAPTAPPAK